MILRNGEYPRSEDAHKHGGHGVFAVETLLTRAQLNRAGRLFARGTLAPGDSVGMHTHRDDLELCYFLQGRGLVREPDGEMEVGPGDSNLVLPGQAHEVVNIGQEPLVYLAVVLFPDGAPQAAPSCETDEKSV